VILEFDGRRVDDDNHLVNLVSLTPLGREIDLTIFRDGRSQPLKVRVAGRNDGE
jgi:serine protease Do